MGCGCGGKPPGDGWTQIPTDKWAMEQPIATTAPPAQPQPGRAPADTSPSWPLWVWGLLALILLSYWSRQ